MTNSSSVSNNPAPSAAEVRTSPVERAIANAAQRTGIDFDYLLAQAQVESSLNPSARAPTSSAAGLFQFIESTWLETMQRHGSRFGLGNIAGQISNSPSGAAQVANTAQREAILSLRNDPQIASLMAAGLAEDNASSLTPILGRQPGHGELYLAHFLGAGGAGRFLSAMAENSDQNAAALFAKPAAANPSIFYSANGSARSLKGVMQLLTAKIERAMDGQPSEKGGFIQTASGRLVAPSAVTSQAAAISPMVRRNRPSTPAPLAAPPLPQQAPPISNVLRDTFGSGFGSSKSTAQIERAYNKLKAFGL